MQKIKLEKSKTLPDYYIVKSIDLISSLELLLKYYPEDLIVCGKTMTISYLINFASDNREFVTLSKEDIQYLNKLYKIRNDNERLYKVKRNYGDK